MKINVREIVLFGLLGGLMYVLQLMMEFLPNVHLNGVLIVAMTVVFRFKALYPIYVYVFLEGVFSGFNVWWIPYLYIWAPLWGLTMLLPKTLPEKVKPFVYACISALHGFLFGILYSPAEALFSGLDVNGWIVWMLRGLGFDAIHGVSNFVWGFLTIPAIKLFEYAKKLLQIK
ncbi:MAG: hypothetical protein IKB86_05340 [Clostridia bacterium]|nr:hypothetical protein [Clostridia bacterium]